MKELWKKYRELITYGFCGAATTAVNYAVYFPCTRLLGIDPLISNGIAWTAAVAFAYLVNKLLVFESKSWNRSVVFREIWQFVSARVLSGVLETGILFLFVTLLHFDDGVIKIAAGVLVIIINYFLSKFLIFRRASPADGKENHPQP